jgi:four helix bundle protein
MSEPPPDRVYDLEERTYLFAKRVRAFVKKLPHTPTNADDIRQVGRSSGSIGANYIEANEALGKKDFLVELKTSRRESKESRYWLRLLDTADDSEAEKERAALIREASELMKIFGSIISKS